jgi:hypothetical protein
VYCARAVADAYDCFLYYFGGVFVAFDSAERHEIRILTKRIQESHSKFLPFLQPAHDLRAR